MTEKPRASLTPSTWTLGGALGVRAALFSLGVSACGGANGTGEPAGGSVGTSGVTSASCEVKLDGGAPQLAAPQPFSPPRSSIELTTRIAEPELLKLLERELPVVLAQEKKKSVGAAGKADFIVRRGKPVLNATKDQLEVRVPIDVEIDVCKPFGGVCIRYGHCEPAFEAVFRVSTKVGEDYALPRPVGELSATKRCVIGIDVTPQILSEARREVNKVEAQIAQRMPSVKKDAEQLWARVQAPLKLPDESCVRFEPERITYRAPAKDAGFFEASLGIEGAVVPAECAAASKDKSNLGPLARGKTEGGAATAWLPTKIEMERVQEELSKTLSGAVDDENEIAAVEVRPTDGKLALGVTLRGAHCGTLWLTGKPVVTASGDAVGLAEVALLKPESIANADFASALVRHVIARGRVSLSLDAPRVKKLSDEWLARAQGELPKGAKLSWDSAAEAKSAAAEAKSAAPERRGAAFVTPEGVIVAVPFGARGRIEGVSGLLGK